ncbi:nucleotide exchange factor GrpE [Candidatus Gottesmanbacteria bacterium RBG_13_45_10]|uniref:Protein GrpE n=1 Tax=Candidatus Gottesmanbacteria bacterium RBG_13_45_10 TaxID=1798370 RepID=A0A1F5ZGR1_9BACT|nr:MAG: nucleotide exchange factor GrpE [Candidatus Gottesmanbacteria bacterium RBG_13_45_10]
MKKQDQKQHIKQEDHGKQNIEELEKHVEEWKNKYLRALADYQNLERRTHTEKEEVRIFAGEHIFARFLPAMDTLAKANEHIQDAGLALAFKEFQVAFSELGVEKIEVVGKAFNPHEMECIEVTQGNDNEVVEEVLPGYRYHGKMLRVAQVKVGKKEA